MNHPGNKMMITIQLCSILILVLFVGAKTQAQSPRATSAHKQSQSNTNVTPMAASLQVLGSGTIGRLTKWTGLTSSNSFIGDTTIFESKDGLVGIGTDSPTSKLTVAGMIQTTLGGIKFPDGTVQASAFDASQVVRTLNGLKGDVQLVAGSNISILPSGNSLTISAGGVLTSVNHDQTLSGNGTAGAPLGVAVPLIISGSVDNGNGVITVTNVAAGAPGIFAIGGNSSPTVGGGSGLISLGGSGNNAPGGSGLVSFGGNATAGSGGTGGSLIGGVGTNVGNGGDGLFAVGALGTGAGKKGGRGIVAIAGGGASGATAGLAGDFVGDVSVSGNLSKGGGSFKIDHPLDPENKYLYHSFVESPDMKNIYDGNVTTDENGEAVVTLPDWFEALNRDFRYQLTVIGTFAQAIVAEKIKGNRFTIKTSVPGVEVSWQLTGIRRDAYANKHRIPVEEQKPENERGSFLHPDAFNQPEERGVEWVRSVEMMRQMKERSMRLKN